MLNGVRFQLENQVELQTPENAQVLTDTSRLYINILSVQRYLTSQKYTKIQLVLGGALKNRGKGAL